VRQNVSGNGYQAFTTGGPREGSESVVVLKGDQYGNIVVYNVPTGTAARLAKVAAAHIG
jgi:hypothetical protein